MVHLNSLGHSCPISVSLVKIYNHFLPLHSMFMKYFKIDIVFLHVDHQVVPEELQVLHGQAGLVNGTRIMMKRFVINWVSGLTFINKFMVFSVIITEVLLISSSSMKVSSVKIFSLGSMMASAVISSSTWLMHSGWTKFDIYKPPSFKTKDHNRDCLGTEEEKICKTYKNWVHTKQWNWNKFMKAPAISYGLYN